MNIRFDAERVRAALANPAQSGLDDVELSILALFLETAGDTGEINIIDDTKAPKKKRKPRPKRIKLSKVK
ncbi:hypothetical protein CJP16_07270 [Aeromonas sobria]|uniref:Uncharacterized protein n=1 Tax=Aeromonas sobria TaxID=646 RepID=A0A2N3J403_AERSO|nr:hypothetical protein [Aeromonas sobria]PKQ80579.1 hypothetical protein CJP16_07270 [Aeromonas sobria]